MPDYRIRGHLVKSLTNLTTTLLIFFVCFLWGLNGEIGTAFAGGGYRTITFDLKKGLNGVSMAVENAHFNAAVEVAGGVTQGAARASIDTLSMADVLFLHDLSAPLSLSTEKVELAPIEAKVAGGTATGGITTHMEGDFRYEGRLDLSGVAVKPSKKLGSK